MKLFSRFGLTGLIGVTISRVAQCTPGSSGSHFGLPEHLQYSPSKPFGVVDPDHAWNKRQTGIHPEWHVGGGFWQHYNTTKLVEEGEFEIWTQGIMKKHLRLVNDSTFELWSVYQPEAQGNWLKGFMEKRPDGNLEHQHTFVQTPHRVTNVMGEVARVFLVQPQAATFSGTLRLNDGPHPLALQFCELWLAEDYQGKPEGRKVGVFVLYKEGRLAQIFQCHEISKGIVDSPSNDVNFTDTVFPVPQKLEFTSGATAIGRVVHLLDGVEVAETAMETEGPLVDNGNHSADMYFHLDLTNQAYLRIPKSMHDFIGVNDNKQPLVLEFGCARLDGSCHRISVFGQVPGHYHTLAYERWETQ